MPAILAFFLIAQPAFAQQKPWTPRFSPNEVRSAQQDPRAYTIDPESVRFIKLGPAVIAQGGQAEPPLPDPGGSIDPSMIINIAKEIWQIILDNQPVVDVKISYAAAVPKGVDHWTQLAGWQPPQGTVYQFVAKNMYGAKTIDVKFQVLRTAGGNYNGKGKYLTNVTVEPLMVSVNWGYKLSLEASVPAESIANVGSTEDPIAGMVAGLRWAIHTPVKHIEGKSLYYLQGDGLFRELGGPFQIEGFDEVKNVLESLRKPISWD
ncbi:MAG: hypothetical protein HY922_03565 [Elusimicrobia bacterium]|nr:hypothetical protein [Elusimicrobiota bacterium]